MSQMGLGAMLHHLSGGTEHGSSEYEGLKITSAEIVDNRLKLSFDNGKNIAIWDNGQSCCESRYMTTDDNVQSLVGAHLKGIMTKAGPDEPDEYGECHEQVFVEIQTDTGFVTIVNHNQHNGYYGGFGLTITE